jgi:hypothetical protein
MKSYISISKKQTPSGKSSKEKSLPSSQNNDPSFINMSQLNNQLEAIHQESHDMETDFKGWLKWQKNIWRQKRKNRAFDGMSSFGSGNHITSMYRSLEQNVLSSVWHILQIHETDTPGIFKMWVYLESQQIIPIRLRMKRTFYINSLVQANIEDFKLVKKKLPRGKHSLIC